MLFRSPPAGVTYFCPTNNSQRSRHHGVGVGTATQLLPLIEVIREHKGKLGVLTLCVKTFNLRGAWEAQSVKWPTSAQVMISRSVSWSPRVGLCADNSEPEACFRFCVSLSLTLRS